MHEIRDEKKHMKLVWVIAFIFLSSSSCFYDKEFTHLNDQIITLNERITKLQESVNMKTSSSDLESGLQSIRSGQADLGVEVDRIKGEMAELTGRTEENRHLIKHEVERDQSERDAMETKLALLLEKVQKLEEIVQRHQEHLKLEPLTAQGDQEREKGTTNQKETDNQPAELVGKPKSKELELYDNSRAFFTKKDFAKAMDGFEEFLKEYPKSDRADNAQFWIGECFMAQKEYEKAILAYQEVLKNYPKGNKAPVAMLRQAVAFMEIKDERAYKALLKNLIKTYPDSPEAKIAKGKLEKIE